MSQTIAITGATGLLGRNLLMEFIKKNSDQLSQLYIYVLSRKGKYANLKSRIYDIIIREEIDYLDNCIPIDLLKHFINNNIYCFEINLEEEQIISDQDYKSFSSTSIDVFYHIAASTDFRPGSKISGRLESINIRGTESILEFTQCGNIAQFCYVSSAYCCGETTGEIQPNYVNENQNFRNNYERSKLVAEVKVREFCERNHQKYKVFRPATISGRLIEPELGRINKFDVFYGWGAFFLKMKIKDFGLNQSNLYDPIEQNCRIIYNNYSGLNIVPVDYCAKIMYFVCHDNHPEISFHLANNFETPHSLYLNAMIKMFGVGFVHRVDEILDNISPIEQTYMKTVGMLFTPYINSEPMLFDNSNLVELKSENQIECPPVDQSNLDILLTYAKKFNFGLRF